MSLNITETVITLSKIRADPFYLSQLVMYHKSWRINEYIQLFADVDLASQ